MAKKKRKPDPTLICMRKNKGWAFKGEMTVEQYKQAEELITRELEDLPPEEFEAKYKTWMY